MRRLCLLLIGVLVLAGTAAALDPVNLYVKSGSTAVTADNRDVAEITVLVTNGVGSAIKDANITLSVTSPWALQDTSGMTGGDGKFVTRLLPTTTAGTAVITATAEVLGVTTTPLVQTFSLPVVAGTAARIVPSYQSTGSVGAIVDITIRVTDQYGNPVTSRIKKNSAIFFTTMTGENVFLDTTGKSPKKVKSLSVDLNETGYADVDFMLNTRPGDNFIVIYPPSPLPSILVSIRGIANLPPSIITGIVTPSGRPPTLPTDNTSKFTINYLLTDQYGNPSIFRGISITTNSGETRAVTSNSEGKVAISYGPKTGAGRYIITAASQDNPKVSAVQTVQFVSGHASDMSLTASPQTMASHEVDPGVTSLVMAKVVDQLGNPVQKQTVSFSIQEVKTGAFTPTAGPSIRGDSGVTNKVRDEVTSVTDESGYALATFTPGSFISDQANTNFSLMAEGTAMVRAKWSNKQVDLNLKYVNYPYLSVYSSATPATVETNGTVDLSILIKGDGYALKPKPVDAFMVTDRSGSMSSGNPSRMDLVKDAAQAFSDQFDYRVDRLGQFSFGDDSYYDQDVTLDQGLTNSSAQIGNAITLLTASGRTPMRKALYIAITELAKYKGTDSVKGIVVLSDGDYNWYGDPLARDADKGKTAATRSPSDSSYYDDNTRYWTKFGGGIKENMAEYAKANNIRIYAIGYSNSLTGEGQATLRTLAESTNGKYYYALTPEDLLNFYGQIAGALKDTAGVNTTLSLDFSSVSVNGNKVKPGSKALQYVFINGVSTKVTRPNGTFYTMNSTADWNNGGINVSIGTVKVNEDWIVNVTLKLLMDGNIQLIGSSSKVYFNDNQGISATIPAPDTFVTSIPAGTDKGLTTPKLAITDLRKINPETDRDDAELTWVISYNGKDSLIREEIEIAPANSEAYSPKAIIYAANADTSGTKTVDVSNLPPGVYKARITGFVSDADSSFNVTQFSLVGPAPQTNIIIH